MGRIVMIVLAFLLAGMPVQAQAKEKRLTYAVELIASDGGKITPNRRSLKEGEKNVRFSINPDKGYGVADVSINGASRGTSSTITLPVVSGPVKVVAVFVRCVPFVNAGNSITTFPGVPVTLNGIAAPAIVGDEIDYEWKVAQKTGGGKATFSDRTSLSPTFLATRPGVYELQLRVTEQKNKVSDTVTVYVLPSPEKNPPIAWPTAPASVFVGQQTTLSGSGSYDPSGLPLSYAWEVVSRPEGSSAILTNSSTVSPQIVPDLPGVYVVKLTVSNEYAASESEFVVIRATQNLAPVADAGPDQNVLPGATVSLDGRASIDPDGGNVTFSWAFQSCPQDICPMLQNSTTATPSFTAGQTGTYILRLTVNDGSYQSGMDTVRITSSVVATDPDFLKLQWQYGNFGTSIGQAGIHVVDIDGDGEPEIVTSASAGGFSSNSLWYILRRTPEGEYKQIWRSEGYASTIVKLLVADVTNDGKVDVIIALSDGTIKIYDGPTLSEVREFTAVGQLYDVAVADFDGDEKAEVVTTNGSGVFIYSSDSGELKWSLQNGGGTSLAVGNVDTDSALEIVTTSSGGKGYVIDATSHAVEWEWANGFGYRVRLGDLDGDGMDEIVGAASWYKITIYDADIKTPSWEIPTDLDIDAVIVADLDDDGTPEVLYGDRQGGDIHVIDASTHKEKATIYNQNAGVAGIAVGDADKDGSKELVWGTGWYSTGADYLYVADAKTGTTEWTSVHVDGPLSPVDVGDVDGDGDDEIVMVSFESDSGYDEGIVHVFDAKTHALEYREKLGIMDWMGVRSLRIGDVDGDGKNEFVVTTANIYDGIVRVYDGATRTVKYDSAGYDGNFFSAIAIADVDNDGKNEIIAGQGREHTGAEGSYLIVFDGATLQEKWRSVDLGMYWGYVRDIKVADINGDGKKEIVAALGSQLIIYDGVTHNLKFLGDQSAISLEIADTDGDGAKEILVGRADGKVDVINGTTFAVKKTISTTSTNQSVDAIRVVDLTGDGNPELLVAHGEVFDILDGKTQTVKWTSPRLSANLGLFNHLVVKDTDGDGRQEVFLGGNDSLYHFEQSP